eukprot:GEMP01030967.1.p1 GENE.GEMP01030967.1~~GEMP01030967.1.p1  ORF type:complete len:297 (+),score=34.25 GEMP01030967.1:130-1020(+)
MAGPVFVTRVLAAATAARRCRSIWRSPPLGRWSTRICWDDTSWTVCTSWKLRIPMSVRIWFGSPELHIYYKQLVFDEADKNSMLRPGYRLGFSYAPDATVPQYAALSEYNGRYVLQPRYVHMRHQKYAIFPITFNSPGKKWVVSGLLGEPRTRQILFTAEDPSDNRYMPPQGPWLPDLGFVIKPACRNHVGDLTCMHLQPACKLGGQDVEWIQQCCRDTCDNCPVSRALCPLPKRRDPFGAPTAPPADPIAPPVQVFAVPTAAPAPAASSPPLATQPPSPPVALLRKTKTQAAIAT